MIKFLKWTGFAVVLLLLIACGSTWWWVKSAAPAYNGTRNLSGLKAETEVLFDEHGIPHIYADNELDAYTALGYVHASERLFQMEMIRRVVNGQLSEILGPDLLQTDIHFRTLGMHQESQKLTAQFLSDPSQPYQQAAEAYLKGLNQYIEKGTTPIEFSILGIQKRPFTKENLFDITGYMAYGFAAGFKVDPVLDHILQQLGPEYLEDFTLDYLPGEQRIHSWPKDSISMAAHFHQISKNIPLPLLRGSNSWIVGPDKSASGQVIFANDPHIGYSQPSVWYEAHLVTPGFNFYGYHLAGFPFGVIGHTDRFAIGMTMLENDDTNFYREKTDADHPDQIWKKDHWEKMAVREESISIKGQADTTIRIRTTSHGPIINDGFTSVSEAAPISLWWLYLQQPSNVLKAAYDLSHAKNMDEAAAGAAQIAAPGLNIMYGDIEGNIAWWGAAKLPMFGRKVQTKVFLDGASGEDEVIGYHPFSENPQAINPPWGYVYSANNQPDSLSDGYHSGYYAPEDRAKRIVQLLESQEKWSADEIRQMTLDDVSPVAVEVVKKITAGMLTPPEGVEWDMLLRWDGNHQVESIAPTIYYQLLYDIVVGAMGDELAAEDLNALMPAFELKSSIEHLMSNEQSIWWDNIKTEDRTESRSDILLAAWEKTIATLRRVYGLDEETWTWGQAHTLTHGHVLGRVAPFDKIFNVGPFPVAGGSEVINNVGFPYGGEGSYASNFGPSRRAVIDFADLAHSTSILPTGQSGVVSSPYYADQAELYHAGKFRYQRMDRTEIEANLGGRMVLKPENP
ncbi:MAG: penicillin acylase family protein [Bacteroidota bacterium]